MERKRNEEVEWQESEKPVGHGDKLQERTSDRDEGESPNRTVPYGDMDQPGTDPDLDDAEP